VLAGPDGRWAAVEVKLGPGQVEQAAKTLLTFAAKVDPDVHHDPDALIVVTGTGLAYTRPDGRPGGAGRPARPLNPLEPGSAIWCSDISLAGQ
jgi:hypothetical protein